MKKLIIIFFLCLTYFLHSQQIEFIDNLYKQKNATYYDCIKSFCYLNNLEVTNNFEKDLESLKKIIKYLPKNIPDEKKLSLGNFSLLAIQYLKIESGMMYFATHSGRYASRELMMRGLIPFNASEWEEMSGAELISNLQKVVEYAEKK